MKKVLSVVLALCLTLLMCVPAFAADITLTQDTADSATVTVQTSDWEDAARFTVTIPATVTIPWGGTSAENGGDTFTWSYESQLLNGQHLEMWLDKSAGALTAQGSVFSLDYTLGGSVPVETAKFCTAGPVASGSQTTSISIAASQWAAAAFAAYSDTLTFTVEVSDEATHAGA